MIVTSENITSKQIAIPATLESAVISIAVPSPSTCPKINATTPSTDKIIKKTRQPLSLFILFLVFSAILSFFLNSAAVFLFSASASEGHVLRFLGGGTRYRDRHERAFGLSQRRRVFRTFPSFAD